MPNYSKNPLLAESDEEYVMLIEVCEEFERQKIDKTAREKSGNPTEIVIAQSPHEKKPQPINISGRYNSGI